MLRPVSSMRVLRASQNCIEKPINFAFLHNLEEVYLDSNRLPEMDLSYQDELQILKAAKNRLEKLQISTKTKLQ